MARRYDEPTDPLFGVDGTGGDGVGPLPGFTLPVLELPTVGPDGTVHGVAGGEDPGGEDPGGEDPDGEDPDGEDPERELPGER